MLADLDVRGQQGGNFFTVIIMYGSWSGLLARSDGLKLKLPMDGFVSYKHTAFHFTRN